MSPLWLLLIIPGYLFIGGFTWVAWHNRKGHDQERCASGADFPNCVMTGAFWPAIIPVAVAVGIVIAGMRAEKLRPVRRREMRDSKIEALEKENGLR